MTNNYETMFVLSVGESEEATASLVERIKALVSANGTLALTNGVSASLHIPSTTKQRAITFS